MKILADRVLILPDPAERVTASGIIIADTVTSTAAELVTGRVVAVGGGRTTDAGLVIPCEVQVGQRVYYKIHAAHELDIADVPHHQVRDNDCVAIIVE